MTQSKNTFFTNGRDSKIKFFDIRGLGYKSSDINNEKNDELQPIFEFKDHNSDNFNITPCLLECQKYIVTGSLDNLLYFYDLETGLLSHHLPTESSLIAGVYDLSDITQKQFNICYITTQDSSIKILEPRPD